MVAFAGAELGAIPSGISKGELLNPMTSKHPEDKPGTIKSWDSQLYRFLEERKAGDTVVTYDQEQRTTSARSAPAATRPFPTSTWLTPRPSNGTARFSETHFRPAPETRWGLSRLSSKSQPMPSMT